MVRFNAWPVSRTTGCTVAAALLAATLSEGAERRSKLKLFQDLTHVIDRCYFQDRRYQAEHALRFTDVDFIACQQRCQNITNCAFFAYWKASQACWLAGADGVFTSQGADGAVAGPKFCPRVPTACTEVPGAGFPGSTATESALAFVSHRVPEKLECWPTNVSGGFYDSCDRISVLEDTRKGWPGLCMGLRKVLVPWGQTCESYCRRKVSCSVYQVRNDTGRSCYHSRLSGGSHCYMRTPDPDFAAPLEAKRLMHGRVRVLKDLVGVQIMGLVQAFDENYFLNVTRDAVPACRSNCYSNLGCQWWQYSRAIGCWVEDPRTPVPFPMTTEDWKTDTYFASTVIGGEYIQHVCPGKAGLPVGYHPDVVEHPTVPPPSSATSQPSFPRYAAREKTLQGTLIVHGLYFAGMTEAHKLLLRDNCTELIARAVGVNRTWVKNDAGQPAQVTVSSSGAGTRVGFLLDVPKGMSNNDVKRGLLQHSFIDAVKRAAQGLSGDELGRAALSVGIHLDDTTTLLPPPARTTSPPTEDDKVPLLKWWLVPIGLVTGLAAFWLIRSQSQSCAPSAREKRRLNGKSPPTKRNTQNGGTDELPLLAPSGSPAQSEGSSAGGRDILGGPIDIVPPTVGELPPAAASGRLSTGGRQMERVSQRSDLQPGALRPPTLMVPALRGTPMPRVSGPPVQGQFPMRRG